MRQSELFTKTRREAPKDEIAKNAELLIRAGYINKELAGVYSYLPLGFRVMKKIEAIIREEMNAVGGQEVFLTTLQDPDIWKKTNRWDDKDVDIWFKTNLYGGGELGLGNTHEEEITNIMRRHLSSHKDLPVYAYQIQSKFRNELRAKSGLLRGREFIMKDLYSFNKDEAGQLQFFEECKGAYEAIFDRIGIGEQTYLTFASGGTFSKYSYEYQTISDAGEDTIYLDEKKRLAVNKEVYTDAVLEELGLDNGALTEQRAIEVGNLFTLGTRFSEALGLLFTDENGTEHPVFMGSYGIGLGRVMATVVETRADEKGIVWPASVAPFQVHLVELEDGLGRKLYDKLRSEEVEVLYDDRALAAGEKFNDADLIGIPWRFVVSEKTGDKVECKQRTAEETETVTYDRAIQKLL